MHCILVLLEDVHTVFDVFRLAHVKLTSAWESVSGSVRLMEQVQLSRHRLGSKVCVDVVCFATGWLCWWLDVSR